MNGFLTSRLVPAASNSPHASQRESAYPCRLLESRQSALGQALPLRASQQPLKYPSLENS